MRRIPLWTIGATLAIVVVLLLIAEPVRASLEDRLNPPIVADAAAVVPQREAAEHALARGYGKAIDQLRSTANVRLPVSAAQAATIQQRAVTDLKTVRRAALADLAHASGLAGADATAYIGAAEPRLDDATQYANEPGALLAPGFFAIVSRADALFVQVADLATRELTTAPSPTPAPSPTR
jgi:hypothetical protein